MNKIIQTKPQGTIIGSSSPERAGSIHRNCGWSTNQAQIPIFRYNFEFLKYLHTCAILTAWYKCPSWIWKQKKPKIRKHCIYPSEQKNVFAYYTGSETTRYLNIHFFFLTACCFILHSSYNNLAIHLYFRIISDITFLQGTGLCQKDNIVCTQSFLFIRSNNIAIIFAFFSFAFVSEFLKQHTFKALIMIP